jgi:hypothetical protein
MGSAFKRLQLAIFNPEDKSDGPEHFHFMAQEV